jgi:hypothetical protein
VLDPDFLPGGRHKRCREKVPASRCKYVQPCRKNLERNYTNLDVRIVINLNFRHKKNSLDR